MVFHYSGIRNILSNKEFERFGRFIRSPFFNSEPRFNKLYELLKDSKETPSPETIAAKIFGNASACSEPRYRKLTSEFLQLFERFLSELEFEKDIYRQTLGAAEQLNKRGAADSALSILKQTVESLEKMPMKDEALLNRLLEIYSLQYSIIGSDYKNWKNDMAFKINDCLDEYFVTFKSFLFTRMLSLEKIFQAESHVERSFELCLKEYAGGDNTILSPTNSDAYTRYILYEMIKDAEAAPQLQKYLSALAKAEEAAPGKCKVLYADLMNYYLNLVNLGKIEFESKVLEIGRMMENKGYFGQGINFIEIATIVEAAIGACEYDWALEFLERMRNKINEVKGESIYSSYAAKLHFFKKDYPNARKHINCVELSDYLRYSESKLLECRILYDEWLVAELMLSADKIGKYLKSHKEIGAHYRRAYSYFLDALKDLTKLREKMQQGKKVGFELSKLRERLQKPGALIYAQAWLVEKIIEIEKAG